MSSVFDWNASPVKTKPPQHKTELKPRKSFIRRNHNTGRLEQVFIDDDKGIKQIDAYMDRALCGRKQVESKEQQFLQVLNQTKCFYCLDSGLISKECDVPFGGASKTYRFTWLCVCQKEAERPMGRGSVPNITDLIERGLVSLTCRIGGDDGSDCTIYPARDSRCRQLNCPRDRKENNQ